MKNKQLIIKIKAELSEATSPKAKPFCISIGQRPMKRIHAQIQALQGHNPKQYLTSP